MPKEMLLLNSKKKEPSSPLLIRIKIADKTQKQNNDDLTMLSPKRSSGKEFHSKSRTQIFSILLLCHPQIMASIVKVQMAAGALAIAFECQAPRRMKQERTNGLSLL